MKRTRVIPRSDYKEQLESVGVLWHSVDDYWSESTCYEFTIAEVDKLEAVTGELHDMAIKAAEHVVEKKLYSKIGIDASLVPAIENSWNEDHPQVYGRLDLWYDGSSDAKLLEYNADTPTGLLEAAIAQWHWFQHHGGDDQWNSLHEKLIERWKFVHAKSPTVHFAALGESVEDRMTTTYMADTAQQGGLEVVTMDMQNIGWDNVEFVDEKNAPIKACFKLYPWEWMAMEEFWPHVIPSGCLFIEPPWKLLLSSKGLLAVLWELYPDHPNLLATHFEDGFLESYAKKPMFGREGSNVELVLMGETLIKTEGDWEGEPVVYQDLRSLPAFDGQHPVLGSWLVNGWPAGLGIRESGSLITGNTSRFVPHRIVG